MWNLLVIAVATVAFFVMDYWEKRQPIILLSCIRNSGSLLSLALKWMVVSAIKWGFAGLALNLVMVTFLVNIQPTYRVVLSSLLCGGLTSHYAPSFLKTGLPEADQRMRNTALIGSNVIASFLAGQAYLHTLLAPIFFLVFILVQMSCDVILAAISMCLIECIPGKKNGQK